MVGPLSIRARQRTHVLVLVVAIGITAGNVRVARATEFGFSEYTYGTNICTGIKDPLNLFYHFDLSTSQNLTEDVLNWTWNPLLGGNQWFADTGHCDVMDLQRSSAWTGSKDHTRLDWSGSNAGITASPMHHDIIVGCGDVADSFNGARNRAKNVYQAAGFFVPYTYTANNASIKQCDGRWTAGDGYFARVYD